MNRAQRRRAARGHEKQPIIIGDGIVATELPGHRYEARPMKDLAPKIPGKHRFVAMGSWVMSEEAAAGALDEDVIKLLDHENLMMLSIGCWDCEQPIGEISYDSRCPAPAAP